MTEPRKPALLGLSAYFLTGLTIGITYLIGYAILGLNPVANRLGDPLTAAIRDGSALTTTLFAFLLVIPLLTAAIAALMGRHGGRTGQPATGSAAVTTLIGIPLAWVLLALPALVVAVVLREQGINAAFTDAVDALIASGIQFLLVLGPLVGLAAMIAHRADAWAVDTEAAVAGPMDYAGMQDEPEQGLGSTDPGAWETPPEDMSPEPETEESIPDSPYALADHPIECPRCGRHFTVTGERPLRISCPDCGKTGTIQ